MNFFKKMCLGAAASTLVVAVGCRTGGGTVEVSLPEPESLESFVPGHVVSGIHAGDVRYGNLFSPKSYAVWVTPGLARMKRDQEVEGGGTVDPFDERAAVQADANYFVFECRMESVFPDSSIAYDVVGLRNLDVYLETPDGRRVPSLQRIMGTHADEWQEGALTGYRRTNILIFPKRNIITGNSVVGVSHDSVRLVIEGFNSTYYFDWSPASGSDSGSGILDPGELTQALGMSFSALYSRLRDLTSLFR